MMTLLTHRHYLIVVLLMVVHGTHTVGLSGKNNLLSLYMQ